MVYNKKYDRWVSKDGLVYRYSKKQDKLILCKLSTDKDGYLKTGVSKPESKTLKVHRLVYETFNGEIPDGYVIDHIDANKENNSLNNLRCVTQKENCNNPLTKKHLSRSCIRSIFGKKFFEHYGFSRSNNVSLYTEEYWWYQKHNKKCRWENE